MADLGPVCTQDVIHKNTCISIPDIGNNFLLKVRHDAF